MEQAAGYEERISSLQAQIRGKECALNTIQEYYGSVKGQKYLRQPVLERYTDEIGRLQASLEGLQKQVEREEMQPLSDWAAQTKKSFTVENELRVVTSNDTLVSCLLSIKGFISKRCYLYISHLLCNRTIVTAILRHPDVDLNEKIDIIRSVPNAVLSTEDVSALFYTFMGKGKIDHALVCLRTGKVTLMRNSVVLAIRSGNLELLQLTVSQRGDCGFSHPLAVLLHSYIMSSSKVQDPTLTKDMVEMYDTAHLRTAYPIPCYDLGSVALAPYNPSEGEIVFGPQTEPVPQKPAVVKVDRPVVHGKGYFEVVVDLRALRVENAVMVGWCDEAFDTSAGVPPGMDAGGHSWGFAIHVIEENVPSMPFPRDTKRGMRYVDGVRPSTPETPARKASRRRSSSVTRGDSFTFPRRSSHVNSEDDENQSLRSDSQLLSPVLAPRPPPCPPRAVPPPSGRVERKRHSVVGFLSTPATPASPSNLRRIGSASVESTPAANTLPFSTRSSAASFNLPNIIATGDGDDDSNADYPSTVFGAFKYYKGRKYPLQTTPPKFAPGERVTLRCLINREERSIQFGVEDVCMPCAYIDITASGLVFPVASITPSRDLESDAEKVAFVVHPGEAKYPMGSTFQPETISSAEKLTAMVSALLRGRNVDVNQRIPFNAPCAHVYKLFPSPADEARRFSRVGHPPDSKGNRNPTLLIASIYAGLFSLAEMLLDEPGISLDAVDQHGNSALIVACARGAVSLVRKLLARKAKMGTANMWGINALNAALMGNSMGAAESLLDCLQQLGDNDARDSFLNQVASVSKETPLLLATRKGFSKVLVRLLDAGVKTTNVNVSGETALLICCKKGAADLAMTLLDRTTVTKEQVNHKERITPCGTALLYAVGFAMRDVMNRLLELGADPSLTWRDTGNLNCLMVAIKQDDEQLALDMIPFFPANKINARESKTELTALNLAASSGMDKVVQALLVAGADPGIPGKHGATPLISAILSGQEETAILIATHPASRTSLDHADHGGFTALCRASAAGMNSLVDILVEGGANVNHVTGTGLTPVLLAISHDNENTALKLLVAANGVLDLETRSEKDGLTALELAFKNGMQNVCGVIIKLGAKAPRYVEEAMAGGRMPPPRNKSELILDNSRSESSLTHRASGTLRRRRSSNFSILGKVQSLWRAKACFKSALSSRGSDVSYGRLRRLSEGVDFLTYIISTTSLRSAKHLKGRREKQHTVLSPPMRLCGEPTVLFSPLSPLDDAGFDATDLDAPALGVALVTLGMAYLVVIGTLSSQQWTEDLIKAWLLEFDGDDFDAYWGLRRLADNTADNPDVANAFDALLTRFDAEISAITLLNYIWPPTYATPDKAFEELQHQLCQERSSARSRKRRTLRGDKERRPTRVASTRSILSQESAESSVQSPRLKKVASFDFPPVLSPQLEPAPIPEVTADFLFDESEEAEMDGEAKEIFAALVQSRFEDVEDLLYEAMEHGCDICDVRTRRGLSVLHVICIVGATQALQAVLQCGADINGAWEDGLTPLMLALLNKHEDIALELIAMRQVDLTTLTTVTRDSALSIAIRNHMHASVHSILDRLTQPLSLSNASATPFLFASMLVAAEHKSYHALIKLLDMTTINLQQSAHLLNVCCEQGLFDIIQDQLQWQVHDVIGGVDGALPNLIAHALKGAKGRPGQLNAAQQWIHSILNSYGTAANIHNILSWKDSQGTMIFHLACLATADSVICTLLNFTRELRLTERDSSRKTPLEYLVAAPHFDWSVMVKLLRKSETKRVRRWLVQNAKLMGQQSFLVVITKLADAHIFGSEGDIPKGDYLGDLTRLFWMAVISLVWFGNEETRSATLRNLERIPLHWYNLVQGWICVMTLCLPVDFNLRRSQAVLSPTTPASPKPPSMPRLLRGSTRRMSVRSPLRVSVAQPPGPSFSSAMELSETDLANNMVRYGINTTEKLAQVLELASRFHIATAVKLAVKLHRALVGQLTHAQKAAVLLSAVGGGCFETLQIFQPTLRLVGGDGKKTLMDVAFANTPNSTIVYYLLESRAPLNAKLLAWIEEQHGSLDYQTKDLRDTLLHIACINEQMDMVEALLESESFSLVTEMNACKLRAVDYTLNSAMWKMVWSHLRKNGISIKDPDYLVHWKDEAFPPSEAHARALLAAFEDVRIVVDTEELCEFSGCWAITMNASYLLRAAQALNIKITKSPASALDLPPTVESLLLDVETHTVSPTTRHMIIKQLLQQTDFSDVPAVTDFRLEPHWQYRNLPHLVQKTKMPLAPKAPATRTLQLPLLAHTDRCSILFVSDESDR